MKNVAYDYRLTPTEYEMVFKRISRPLKSWKEECVENARYIASQTDKPIIIALSGGIDAEVAALAFLEAGIPFKGLSVAQTGNTNEHDISFARTFCQNHNVEHIIVDLDMNDFLTRRVYEYAEQGYRAYHGFRYFQLFLLETIEKMGCTGVFGGGEQIYQRKDESIIMNFSSTFTTALEWIKSNNTLHFPYFHKTTPELVASYLNHELVRVLHSNPYYYYQQYRNFSFEKIKIYQSEWKYININPRPKFNGWEYVDQELQSNLGKFLLEKFGKDPIVTIDVETWRNQLGI